MGFLFVVGLLMLDTIVKAVQVVGRDTTVNQGETAVLSCSLIDTRESLTQISWQKQTRGHPQVSYLATITPGDGLSVLNGDVDRVKFIGNFDNKDGSLELSRVTLMDEGTYTCLFTLFNGGIPQQTVTLHVLAPPTEVNIRQQTEGSWKCEAEAHPAATFRWTRTDGPWPQSSVTADGPTLQVVTWTPSLNGLYQCEASNQYGSKYKLLSIHVAPGGCTVCWILFSLSLLLNVVVVGMWLLCRSGLVDRIPIPQTWQPVQRKSSSQNGAAREAPEEVVRESDSL